MARISVKLLYSLLVVLAVADPKLDVLAKVSSLTSEAPANLEDFVLSSPLQSNLFAACIEKLNTLTGSIYSIVVNGDMTYIRHQTEEVKPVNWTAVAGVDGFANCAKEAGMQGALMFKFTLGDGCHASLDVAYNSSASSCDGEEVYLLQVPCYDDDGNKYYPGEKDSPSPCARTCSSDGTWDDPSALSGPPSEAYACCPYDRYIEMFDYGPPDAKCRSLEYGFNQCQGIAQCKARGMNLARHLTQDDYLVSYAFHISAYRDVTGDNGVFLGLYSTEDANGELKWVDIESGNGISRFYLAWLPSPSAPGLCVQSRYYGSPTLSFAEIPCTDVSYIVCGGVDLPDCSPEIDDF